ncbi:proline-rich membrane anchor 1 isoform X3 [Paroedura picta]|uniref:proline-rich membrane anchor 1 isoform X3 n=1 Tax=Paroedura picta TaxID=143630 RepID=UPI0040569650
MHVSLKRHSILGEKKKNASSKKITQGEPQKSCSRPVAEKVTDSCQQICQCRPPPLPPPPPPPPPPRLLGVSSSPTDPPCPPEDTWWPSPVLIIAACCTTPVFLFLVFIICYKAIKSGREHCKLLYPMLPDIYLPLRLTERGSSILDIPRPEKK